MPTINEADIDVHNLTPAGQRILDVASDLFYKQGIRAAGVDLIANEADVTKKTIYDRFGSKDALVKAYLQRLDDNWHELVRKRVQEPDMLARERILAMFEIMTEEVRSRGCGFTNAYAELSEPDHPALDVARSQKAWIRDYFTELADEAGAENPKTLGTQLMMLHEGAYIAFAMLDQLDAAQSARDAAEMLLDAALPD